MSKTFEIPNILDSIRKDVIHGRKSLAEATKELHESGWMHCYDEDKAKRLLRLKSESGASRLIDAKVAEDIIWERSEELKNEGFPELSGVLAAAIGYIDKAPTVETIPIAVMKREISGIDAAFQCDQAGRYDLDLKSALQVVLRWYESPRYKETEKRCQV